ncbi:uncharacterized protein LOC143247881 [Tachypleus tridentatus]|uniref:uncharacterized protein LOC143247881 n=1 Tax=Tachypleus tridentatus TaxID=6853 RepID=UPI003FD68506
MTNSDRNEVHKPNIPLRLIMTAQNSPYQLAIFLDIMVSFDVIDLSTNVPTSETLYITRQRLLNENSLSHRTDMKTDAIMELTTICLQSTYFQYNEELYKQTDGLAMGSPLSPILADIFMEDFEERVPSSTPIKPSFYKRFVDDTFVIWHHGHENLPAFLEHLSSVDKIIHFTMEVEKQNSLSFLDILINKQARQVTTTVYRKRTDTYTSSPIIQPR